MRATVLSVLGLSLLLGAHAAAAGCASHGPPQLRQGHLAYNQALKASVDEELLLNIVRLRYLDTVEFLSASSISTQSEVTVELGGLIGGIGEEEVGGVSGDVGWSTRPTFTFTPQRGTDFARRLLGPVDLSTLTFLASSNWYLSDLMRLFVSEMNGIGNHVAHKEEDDFSRLADLLGRLQDEGRILVGFIERPEAVSAPLPRAAVSPSDFLAAAEKGYAYVASDDGLSLTLTRTAKQTAVVVEPGTPEAAELTTLLDLESRARPYFTIDVGAQIDDDDDDGRDRILVRTRSLLMAMAYLAQGVEVPPGHVQAGYTTWEWPIPGATVTGMAEYFRVRWSATRPKSGLAVPYRGHWFYVSDCDPKSKSAFLHLATLYRLKLTDAETGRAPVLTLPVGR